jgi:hypothetical protein
VIPHPHPSITHTHPTAGAAADGFKTWLAAHGRQLSSLTLTEFYFSHHGFNAAAAAAGAAMRSRLGQVTAGGAGQEICIFI